MMSQRSKREMIEAIRARPSAILMIMHWHYQILSSILISPRIVVQVFLYCKE